jgi:hypothetical protein
VRAQQTSSDAYTPTPPRPHTSASHSAAQPRQGEEDVSATKHGELHATCFSIVLRVEGRGRQTAELQRAAVSYGRRRRARAPRLGRGRRLEGEALVAGRLELCRRSHCDAGKQ